MIKECIFSALRILGLTIVVIILGVALLIYLFFRGMCGEESVGVFPSPNGRHEVSYYIKDCGATTYYVDNIELDGKNILRAEARYPDGVPFSIQWTDNTHVSIETSTSTENVTVYKITDTYNGIDILFDEKIRSGRRVGAD